MKKLLASVLLAVMLAPAAVQAGELSDWAVSGYNAANGAGLIPYSIAANRIKSNITRGEFCELVMNMYNAMKGEAVEIIDCSFTDTENYAVLQAYSLGIINGKSETEFGPYDQITRQEIAKIVMRTINAADKDAHITEDDLEKVIKFDDFTDTDDWAAADMAKSVKYEILNGVSSTHLAPKGTATREQAITIVSRAMEAFSENSTEYSAPKITNLHDGISISETLEVKWEEIKGAQEYAVFVKDANYYCIGMSTTFDNTAVINTGDMRKGQSYYITVAAKLSDYVTVYSEPLRVYYEGKKDEIQVLPNLADRYNRVFPSGQPFESAEEAERYMQTVTFPVWKLSASGEKYSSKMSVVVNRNLAEETVRIFNEIYNDAERFPIKDVGGYSWRMTASGKTQSQHSYGTCIDINYNENYYCYAQTGEAITGSHWKPYEDPYSIPEDGSVVRAFSKYGWSWGGNAWTTLRDYMHFTYLGK